MQRSAQPFRAPIKDLRRIFPDVFTDLENAPEASGGFEGLGSVTWSLQSIKAVLDLAERSSGMTEFRTSLQHIYAESLALNHYLNAVCSQWAGAPHEMAAYDGLRVDSPDIRLQTMLMRWPHQLQVVKKYIRGYDHVLPMVDEVMHVVPPDQPKGTVLDHEQIMQQLSAAQPSELPLLSRIVRVEGKLDFKPLPAQKRPDVQETGAMLVDRDAIVGHYRQTYPHASLVEQRMLDFADVCNFFDGSAWEVHIGGAGAVAVFEHGGMQFALMEWFGAGHASYLMPCEGDDWRDMLELFTRRELVDLGAVQLIHPPSQNGVYAHGDHQIAVLEAVQEMIKKT
jgi:hypothetical protein